MKVAIYCRLSEEDRSKQNEADDSSSIQNQKAMLIQHAAAQGWEVFCIYSDDDYAGADRKRPQFNRLLTDAAQRKFNIILCKTQSRFTRELELVEKYIHGLFPLWGIRFISIVDNADTDNKGNKKSRQINGLVNEWYLEDMSDSIRSVLNSRRESGLHIGAFALYGYQKDPARKGHLVIDHEAAAVVRKVFALFSQGHGKTAIARTLNDQGIPNPTEYKRLHGLRYQQPKSKHSVLWKYSSIADMLGNEIYLGNMVQGKYGSASYKTKQNRPRPKNEWYVVEGTHEPIVDCALWDSVQALRAQRAKPFAEGRVGLFARKTRCQSCGYLMRSSKSRGKHYLQCASRHVSKDACPGAFLSVELLEATVLAQLNQLGVQHLHLDQLEKGIAIHDDSMTKESRLSGELAGYEKSLAGYTKGIRTLYLDKVRGLITEDDFVALTAELTKERARLGRLVAEAQTQLTALSQAPQPREQRCPRTLAEQGRSLAQLDRLAVELLIEEIRVGTRISGTNTVPIEICWSF